MRFSKVQMDKIIKKHDSRVSRRVIVTTFILGMMFGWSIISIPFWFHQVPSLVVQRTLNLTEAGSTPAGDTNN